MNKKLRSKEFESQNELLEEVDIGIKVDAGFNFSKLSIYVGGIYNPTTFLGLEQTATFFTAGLKYNF